MQPTDRGSLRTRFVLQMCSKFSSQAVQFEREIGWMWPLQHICSTSLDRCSFLAAALLQQGDLGKCRALCIVLTLVKKPTLRKTCHSLKALLAKGIPMALKSNLMTTHQQTQENWLVWTSCRLCQHWSWAAAWLWGTLSIIGSCEDPAAFLNQGLLFPQGGRWVTAAAFLTSLLKWESPAAAAAAV